MDKYFFTEHSSHLKQFDTFLFLFPVVLLLYLQLMINNSPAIYLPSLQLSFVIQFTYLKISGIRNASETQGVTQAFRLQFFSKTNYLIVAEMLTKLCHESSKSKRISTVF